MTVERLDAASFVERELSSSSPGVATVVYHSIFWQYVGEMEQKRIVTAIEQAKAGSTPHAPVHHLAMEPNGDRFDVRLDGEVLATTQPHGTGVRWLLS